jgi:hypothetical protein
MVKRQDYFQLLRSPAYYSVASIAAFPTHELILEVQQASVPAESDRIYQLATGEIVLGRSCQ